MPWIVQALEGTVGLKLFNHVTTPFLLRQGFALEQSKTLIGCEAQIHVATNPCCLLSLSSKENPRFVLQSSGFMRRLFQFLRGSLKAKDWCGLSLFGIVCLAASWAVSIVVVPAMRDMALRRFHLGAKSYAVWAAHQAVPAMYNFENKIQFSNDMLGAEASGEPFDTGDKFYYSETMNHFPARFVTFGNRTTTLFQNERQGTFEMSSRYGDTTLVSRWTIESPDGDAMIVRRQPERWMRHND